MKSKYPVVILCLLATAAAAPAGGPSLDAEAAGRFAALALDCVHREYPNKIAHLMQDDDDALPPRLLTPAFFGCFDWHSAVHGHWLLARLARRFPNEPFSKAAIKALGRSITSDNIAVESTYLGGKDRGGFERPYGLAWLLQLAAELREWEQPNAEGWYATLEPLEKRAAANIEEWLPKLSHPIREGEHHQTAFAFGLILDWARGAGNGRMISLVEERARAFYLDDRGCPLDYEPSGHDFLSPCLAEADLMRRVLKPGEFAAWLGGFLPRLPLDGSSAWLQPAVVTDPTDGKLAHLDGLNLSRAWMLRGIAAGLPDGDPRIPSLLATAAEHRRSGLASVTGDHYEGGHWLASFAVYLETGRGLSEAPLEKQ
jgi:hypothetical protein